MTEARPDMRLILHAGLHKTGTTSIQHFAKDNHAALLDQGLYYLQGRTKLGGKTKTWRSNNWLAHGLTGAYDEGEEQAIFAIDRAREQARRGATVLISSEDLSSCCDGHPLWGGLDQPDYRDLQRRYLERLAGLLEGFDIEVVLVFRRADEYAESLYQTMVKSNRFSGDFESFLQHCGPLFDYRAQRDAFSAVFGNVRTLSYHELGSDLVSGFMGEIGFSAEDTGDYRRNTSVDLRLIHWKAMKDAESGNDPKARAAHRNFVLSDAAKALFADAMPASFWAGADEREQFHEKTTRGFEKVGFPGPRDRATAEARVSGADFEAVTRAFDDWQASQQKGWLSRLIKRFR